LNKHFDLQFLSASLDRCGEPACDDGNVNSLSLQQFDAKPVFDVEGLRFGFRSATVGQRAVGHDAVNIEHNELDRLRFLCGPTGHEMPALSSESSVTTPSIS
jgi:hypothetical protein